MPKIRDLIAAAEKDTSGAPYFAIEFFPPRTEEGVHKLRERFGRFKQQHPMYADVTWGAGGGTSDLTMDLCVTLKKDFDLEPNMHLTCTNMPEEKIHQALEGAKKHGIENIVALRGDPPKGAETWTATAGGFTCALDLIKYIRATYGDDFNISTAGYPEGHPNVIKKVEPGAAAALSEAEKKRVITLEDGDWVCYDADYASELAYLKQKVDAGADMIITQMFFDVDVFLAFVKDCRAIGITVPILPGIMLIQAYGGFKRMVSFCKSRVPAYINDMVEAVKDDDAKVRAAGIQIGTAMCKQLLDAGCRGLHLYTLNLEDGCYGILKELGLYKEPAAATAAAAAPAAAAGNTAAAAATTTA